MRIFKVQPSPRVDHITPDGVEFTQLPHPFFVDEEGFIERQDVWKGDPYRVVGFAKDPSVYVIDLSWPDVVEDPSRAVGMYLVTANEADTFEEETWSTYHIAVSDVVEIEKGA